MKLSSFVPKLRINLRSNSSLRKTNAAFLSENDDFDNSSFIKEGYLWKMRNGFAPRICRWKKRYLVLSEEGILFLKKKGNIESPFKIVRIFDVVSLMLEDFTGIRTKAFGIRLQAKAERETLLLRCRSEDERNDWITAVLTAKSASLVSQTS